MSSRFVMQYQPQVQQTIGTAAATIASLLSLTTDDQCLVTQLSIQNDPANAAPIYVGGVDASGAADVTATKCQKVLVGNSIDFCPENQVNKHEKVFVDLRQISVKAPNAGYLINIAFLNLTAIKHI